MHKVVINNCYGGFGLSKEAMLRLLELGFIDEYYSKKEVENYEHPHTSFYPSIERHNPLLIQVVEELGKKANGACAELKIVEIDSNMYIINEYDGWESVKTPNTAVDWIVIN